MDSLELAFGDSKCINIRIDLTKDLPLTILTKNPQISKKDKKIKLKDLVKAEDLPPLADMLNEIVTGTQKTLNAHCRVQFGDGYKWVFLCCESRRDTFNRSFHLLGIMLDVSDYLESTDDDYVLAEFKRKNSTKISELNNNGATLVEIMGKDYLTRIQHAFDMTEGVVSAIFDDREQLICTSKPDQHNFSIKKYRYVQREVIRFNHKTAATWVICSDEQELIDKNSNLLEILASTVSQISNAMVVLYNEMENSRKANQQLGANVEEQMLLNSIYSVILETKSAKDALKMVLSMVGEYFKLDRVIIFESMAEPHVIKPFMQWTVRKSYRCDESTAYTDSEYPKFHEELTYYGMYFSSGTDHEFTKHGVKSLAASALSESGHFSGVIFFETLEFERSWSQSDRRLLRSISQIISTMIIRCRMDLEIEKKNAQLEQLAFYDSILGVKNRTKLDADLRRALEKGRNGAALTVKVTNMRSLNEIFGHGYTDKLLRSIVRFVEQMDFAGKAVYRFTGSIMMILLDGADGNAARDFSEMFLERFKKPWIIDGAEHYMEVGVGICLYPVNAATCEDIYKASTLSMYRAVEYGKNSYAFFAQEFERPTGTNYYIEQRLRQAIADGMKGFEVYFQPVLDYNDTKKIAYFESLVRWRDSELGEVAPAKFIRLAENMGFDIAIDTWVIPQACRFCKEMHEKYGYEDLCVSVNLTAGELQHAAVTQIVQDALEESGLDGRNLVVEIPEKAQVLSFSNTSSAIGALKKLGVRITIDNFGREYMSLNTLKNSCIDIIKIGQSLFTTADDEFDKTLLEAIIKLAHSRDIKVCVKKAEFKTQLDVIGNYGIDLVQGNYFIKPLKVEEIYSAIENTADMAVSRK